MLAKKDLNKIQLLITDSLGPVINNVNGVKMDVNEVKQDVSGVKQDINGVKREIDGLKEEIEDVKVSIRLLPTKEEYFNSMDKLMGEVKKVREEQEVIGGTLSQHSDRLERLEEKVGISSPY